MPGVTKEQIAKAKEWDLLSYLQTHEPHELKRCGPREYCTRTHDSLKISNGKWCWNSQGIGGPDGAGLSDKGPGDGLCRRGGSPVWLPCPAAPGAAQAKTAEAL